MSEISSNNNNSDPTIKGDPLSDSNNAAQSRKKITSQNKSPNMENNCCLSLSAI